MYKGEDLCTQRLDMVVDDKVIVETKSTFTCIRPRTDSWIAIFARQVSRLVSYCTSAERRSFIDRTAAIRLGWRQRLLVIS